MNEKFFGKIISWVGLLLVFLAFIFFVGVNNFIGGRKLPSYQRTPIGEDWATALPIAIIGILCFCFGMYLESRRRK